MLEFEFNLLIKIEINKLFNLKLEKIKRFQQWNQF